MKIVHERNYDYLGICGGWYVFSLKVNKFDDELLLLPRAKMVMNDGTIRYFDFQKNKTDIKSALISNLDDRILV